MRCVFATGSESERCTVWIDHYRARKTGPGFPLAVVGCSVHAQGRYTLYPPGYVPYGRDRVVPCSPSQPLLRDETGRLAWQMTFFDAAALEATTGVECCEANAANEPWHRRTQRRRLEAAGRLLGIHPEIEDRTRERIAAQLGVALLTLRAAAKQWTTGWRAQGAAVVAVLLAVTVDARLLDRILAAGALSGLWPASRRWEVACGTWVRARSSGLEYCPTCYPHGRSPPPTTLSAGENFGARLSTQRSPT